jgi:hypothetical protein
LNTATLKAKSPPWTMKAAFGHVPAVQTEALFLGLMELRLSHHIAII